MTIRVWKLVRFCALFLSMLAPQSAVASPSTKTSAGLDSWTHLPTGTLIAAKLASFDRTAVREFKPDQVDVSVGYVDQQTRTEANIFLFRKNSGTVPIWFDQIRHVIDTNPEWGRVAGSTGPRAFIPAGHVIAVG